MQFNLAILFYKNKVLFKDNKKLSNRTFIFIKSQKITIILLNLL